MSQSLAIPRVIPEDWKRLDLIINKIKMRLGSGGSPIFANIYAGRVYAGHGTEGLPAHTFTDHPDAGMYLTGAPAPELRFSVDGHALFSMVVTDWDTGDADVNSHVHFRLINGTAARPSLTFASDPNTGLYRVGADQLGITTAGTLRATFANAGLILANLTATRLVASNASNLLVSSDLASWVTQTADQVLVANDGDGTITLSLPQNIHTGASPTFAGLHINSAADDDVTLLTLESDISNNTEYNEILFKVDGGKEYGAIRSYVGNTAGDSYMAFLTSTIPGGVLVRHVTIQHNGYTGFGTWWPGERIHVVGNAFITGGIELGHASDTTITRVSAGVIAVEGVTVMMVGGAPTAHLHDGDTLEHDGINSSAGAFAFNTGGLITFSESITMSAGKDLTIAGHIIFNTNNSYIGFTNPRITFNDTNDRLDITGGIIGSTTAAFEGASITVGKASTTTGTLVLHDSNSANTITLTVPNISAGSLSFTLPPTDGDNTDVLQTDGNGVLTWVVAGAGADSEKVKVDVGATADYIGAANNDGVLRTGTSLSYTDGGDHVTINTIQDIRTTDSPEFLALNITGAGSLPGTVVVGKIVRLTTDGHLYIGKDAE